VEVEGEEGNAVVAVVVAAAAAAEVAHKMSFLEEEHSQVQHGEQMKSELVLDSSCWTQPKLLVVPSVDLQD
jgi:hypothetical protein